MSDPLLRTRDTYDGLADTYLRHNTEPFPELVDDLSAFRAALPETVGAAARVVDVGCGTGRDLRLLRSYGLRAIGLDLSSGMLAAGRLPGTALADMRALPLTAAGFDGVWCQAALLHVPRAYVPTVFAEFARVLRPRGAVHLAVSEDVGEGWETGAYESESPRWFVHHQLDGLTTLLGRHGFVVRRTARNATPVRRWLRVLAVRER